MATYTMACPDCGGRVRVDGRLAHCTGCGKNSEVEDNTVAEYTCEQCGTRMWVNPRAVSQKCSACGYENDVQHRIHVEAIQLAEYTNIIEYRGDNETLVWKHPLENLAVGSKIIVRESQEAVFFRDGQSMDVLQPGTYTLTLEQLPMLNSTGALAPEGGSCFRSEVYFVNKVIHLAMKWGTPDKVRLIEPINGVPISIGARGQIDVRVGDSRKLMQKSVGTTRGLKRGDVMGDTSSWMRDHFIAVIQMKVGNYLADTIRRKKLDVLQLDEYRIAMSGELREALRPDFMEYGLELIDFSISGIALPQEGDLGYESIQTIIRLRSSGLDKAVAANETEMEIFKLEGDGRVAVQKEINESERELVRRTVIQQRGENSIVEARYAAEVRRIQAEADRVIAASMETWDCPSCGKMGITSKFCPDCGASAPSPVWNCTCGRTNIDSRFCPDCGKKR